MGASNKPMKLSVLLICLSLSYNYIHKANTHENSKDREKLIGIAIIYPTKSLENPLTPFYPMNFYKKQLEYATVRVFAFVSQRYFFNRIKLAPMSIPHFQTLIT